MIETIDQILNEIEVTEIFPNQELFDTSGETILLSVLFLVRGLTEEPFYGYPISERQVEEELSKGRRVFKVPKN